MYVCMYESMYVLCMKLCNNNKEEEVTNWGGTQKELEEEEGIE